MMKSITRNLPLIAGLAAGLAASAIAQAPDTSNPLPANPAPPTNPAPANPPPVAPNANPPVANPAAPTNPAAADIPATSSWRGSTPVGPGHVGGKIGGHGGKGHLGHMHAAKARGLKVHSRNHAGMSKTPEEKAKTNESR
jgi:hypothetical protein